MAQGPICIITPSGMICASSKPMKRHFPKEGPEPARPEAEKVYDAVDKALKSIIPADAVRAIICTVAQLIVQGRVTETSHFTITSAADATPKTA